MTKFMTKIIQYGVVKPINTLYENLVMSKKKNPETPYFKQLSKGFIISRVRESNPPPRLGKPMYDRCTNPAFGI